MKSSVIAILERIPETVQRMEGTVNSSAFWNFEKTCTDKEIGYGGTTVRHEARDLLSLASEAVICYDILEKDREGAMTQRAVERLACGAAEKDEERFLEATRVAQMKALWLNRKCKEMTGRYFFYGRLNHQDGVILVEEAFALVYQIFQCI